MRTRGCCPHSARRKILEDTSFLLLCKLSYSIGLQFAELTALLPLCAADWEIPIGSSTVEFDQEGGDPIKMRIAEADIAGYLSAMEGGSIRFVAPCTFHGSPTTKVVRALTLPLVIFATANEAAVQVSITEPRLTYLMQAADGKAKPWFMLVAFCIPVAPGRSRFIWAFPRNFGVWLYKMIPRWLSHMVTNRVLDSDLSLLHTQVKRDI